MNLIIDPEFSSLIPPLTDEEFAGLEKSIKEEGCRDALVVWDNDGKKILVDGHNRYRICQKHGIEFKTIEKAFDNREDVIEWMCDTQLGRRNLDLLTKFELSKKKNDAHKAKVERNRHIAAGGDRRSEEFQHRQKSDDVERRDYKKENAARTDAKIAKDLNTSRDTVQKLRTISEKADDRTKELVRSGQLSINQAFNSVHPKRPDPVETAKKEHLEYEMRKAEKKVDIQSAQRDKANQKLINTALLKDTLKLLSDIDKFEMEHANMDMNKLSKMVDSEDERKTLIGRCNRCRKVLFKIEEGFRE